MNWCLVSAKSLRTSWLALRYWIFDNSPALKRLWFSANVLVALSTIPLYHSWTSVSSYLLKSQPPPSWLVLSIPYLSPIPASPPPSEYAWASVAFASSSLWSIWCWAVSLTLSAPATFSASTSLKCSSASSGYMGSFKGKKVVNKTISTNKVEKFKEEIVEYFNQLIK